MTLVGSLRGLLYRAEIARRAGEYDLPLGPADREKVQLELLNAEWGRIVGSVPWYGRVAAERGLPPRFGSIAQFCEAVPTTTRSDFQAHPELLSAPSPRPDFFRTTGGSTAQPIQLPSWSSEVAGTRADVWLGRSWYGIDPSSRVFLLWGHSHLLGSGWPGRVAAGRVKIKDRLVGYLRFSAYDLRPEKLREAGRALIAFRPECVIGYSVALDLFARANADRRSALTSLGLRAVIGTSEGFPFPDSAARLEDLFGCPVGMEYGSVETHVVAYTHPSGGYRTLWRSWLIEALPGTSGSRIVVTSLYPRCTPLVRYELGDEIELDPAEEGKEGGITAFRRVLGRCNDFIETPGGAVVHSEVFSHAVRSCPAIEAYQVVDEMDGLRIDYLAAQILPPETVREIRERLARAQPELAGTKIERVSALRRTVAGKTPMIVRLRSEAPAGAADRS